MIEINSSLLEQAKHDLREDFEEIKYLLISSFDQASKFQKIFSSLKKYLPSWTFDYLEKEIRQYQGLYLNNLKKLTEYVVILQSTKFTKKTYLRLLVIKQRYQELLRTTKAVIGSLLVVADWQSPSFFYSLFSMAGKQEKQITATINDYKRDHHNDEKDYEKKYIKEMIDAPFKFNIHAFLTNSGMAAFTTILTYLLCENKIKDKILIGSSIYFQYKQILVKSFKDKIIEVNEIQTDKIINIIKKENPSVIFFDSLCNAIHLPVPNLAEIIQKVDELVKQETYIIIDNTCLSVFFQPFLIKRKRRKVRLIVFESINKYLQFGMDRVTAGIVVASGKDAYGIFEYRKHAGTNISDSSVYALPLPSRKFIEKRLQRYQRNTSLLANFLHNWINNNHSPVKRIDYPGLFNHSSFAWTKNFSFQGSFFNLSFNKKRQTIKSNQQFINIFIQQAKRNNIQVVGGTSFGLNHTRIYLTSLSTKYGQPFIRVSLGTEDLIQLELLKKVFISTFNKFRKKIFIGF